MTLKPIVAALAMALSTSAFAEGGAKHQPRAQGGDSGMTQSQSQAGQQAQSQSPALVKQAQEKLKEKGIEVGSADGQWGPQTQQGVKKFQEQQGLQATGQLDQQTLAALGIQEQSSSAGSSSRGSAGASAGSSGSAGADAPGSSAGGARSSGESAAGGSSQPTPPRDPAGTFQGPYSEGSRK